MANLLFLVHRMPYPPNKGDKVRSYHLLKHLAGKHRVFLGSFIDDPDDERHVPALKSLCADVCLVRLGAHGAKLRGLKGLLHGQALTIGYYRSHELANWVERTVRLHAIDHTIVFSSAMAQYVPDGAPGGVLVDFVDVDSAKWAQYGRTRGWPMSWLYRREARRLLEYERAVASASTGSFFVTNAEARLFLDLAPECAGKVEVIENGVDAGFFTPGPQHASPYEAAELPVVFTGAMDYWPNADAAAWFALDVLPKLRSRSACVRFYIVGRKPLPEVQKLCSDAVVVTGTVDDVRPYLQHAAVVVAPLRVARGIQNKVLEAMAMARPVVTTSACAAAIDGLSGDELCVASDAEEFARHVATLLEEPERSAVMGAAARRHVLAHHDWARNLSRLNRYLEPVLGGHGPVPRPLPSQSVARA